MRGFISSTVILTVKGLLFLVVLCRLYENYFRCHKSFQKLLQIRLWNLHIGERTFSRSAISTSNSRKRNPDMCRINENAITAQILFRLPFKNREKISLYMRGLDSDRQVIRKMHKWATGFYADIRNFRFFSQKRRKRYILPLTFREKKSLIMRG